MVLIEKLKRPVTLAVAALMLVAVAAPVLVQRKASAYGLLGARSIQMSTSAAGATGAEYTVDFDVATAATIEGVVVEFCANSPIVGDACDALAGFDLSGATVTVDAGVTGFTKHVNTTATKLIISGTGVALAANDPVTFRLDGVNNPTATGTFYARILTFTTEAGATGYTSTSPGTEPPLVDAGGIALSTAAQIDITAKVQERLVFCVYTGDIGGGEYANNDCAGKAGSSVVLGDDKGVLSSEEEFVDKTARYSVATNAASNVIIRLKGKTLETGALSIDAIGAVAASSSFGTEQFGFCTHQIAGADLTATTPYDDANCSSTTQTAGTATGGGSGTAQFAFDSVNTDSLYGQSIATKAAGTYSTGELAFIGNISDTTEAGIYTTILTLIATGTY
ncbi:hypothetical protein BH23PAT1_BH23PAT1_4730 [soil metagenome]